jgi:tripartite-type tricarboxylate transporter receptor subunit TctC
LRRKGATGGLAMTIKPISRCLAIVMAAAGATSFTASFKAAAAGAASAVAAYPTKPIRFLVGVAPGGGTDFAARLIGARLAERFGQPVITDNRTGATGNIALEMAARAPADGYTYAVFNVGHLTSAVLSRSARIDAAKDFSSVSQIASGTLMLAMNAGLPAKSLKEFIAHARSNPGRINYGSGGVASTQHLAMALLAHEAKLDLVHVPYKGTGPITVDLVSGQIQVSISNVLGFYPHVKAGRLVALAVTTDKRSPLAPDVATMTELGYPKVQVDIWQGVLAPARTPSAIIEKLSRAIAEIVAEPDVVQKLAAQGATPAGTSPKVFDKFLKDEAAKWLALAKAVNISAD